MSLAKIEIFYSSTKRDHYCQGDLFKGSDFQNSPKPDVPYWMLANRNCHLFPHKQGGPKLKLLQFIAAYELKEFLHLNQDGKTIKNQIIEIIKERIDSAVFLPECSTHDITTPSLVGCFDRIYTLSISDCPKPEKKLMELSSPFSEHVFQRFSRYFYTVGFDDSELKSDSYVSSLIEAVTISNNITK